MEPLELARSGHGTAILAGNIYVSGGENNSQIYDSVACYSPGQF